VPPQTGMAGALDTGERLDQRRIASSGADHKLRYSGP
jgi:hypothetical protein